MGGKDYVMTTGRTLNRITSLGGVFLLLLTMAISLPSAHAVPTGTILFSDDFSADTLDLSQWTVLDGYSGMQVTGGLLRMQGSPDHKDLNSIPTFSPTESSSILAHARIRL